MQTRCTCYYDSRMPIISAIHYFLIGVKAHPIVENSFLMPQVGKYLESRQVTDSRGESTTGSRGPHGLLFLAELLFIVKGFLEKDSLFSLWM